ncbi:MAG TPA: hypothetical protein VHA52_04395 [Candidatus Babeliaceae bacterium]|nr:hypothetical protein [Candidatus Babeliaceae bacterium]
MIRFRKRYTVIWVIVTILFSVAECKYRTILEKVDLDLASPKALLSSLISQYGLERGGVTVLELIGDGRLPCITEFEQLHLVKIALFKKKLDIFQNDMVKDLNITVLNPPNFGVETLSNLERCEHFDIVIVREPRHFLAGHLGKAMDTLLNLGDFIVLEMDAVHQQLWEKNLEQRETFRAKSVDDNGHIWYLFETLKQGIDIARWNLSWMPRSKTPRYLLRSNFTEKILRKSQPPYSSKWVPGINLVTFIELRGIQPDDRTISKSLRSMSHLNHNDLVIGNMVVQGKLLIPIDFNDSRRNIESERCIHAALKIFDGTRVKVTDIKKLMERYAYYLDHYKK